MGQVGASFPLNEACEILKSKDHTDFMLTCEDYKFPVHRLILSHKSPFFRAAFNNGFREKSEGEMNIGETTPTGLAAIIIFCYTNKLEPFEGITAFPDLPQNSKPAKFSKMHYAQLLDICLLADRLLLPSLAGKACAEFFGDLQEGDEVQEGGNDWDEGILTFVRRIYQRLPTSDNAFKPVLTAYGMAETHQLDGDDDIAMRRLLVQEDPAGYCAAQFMDDWHAKAGYWECTNRAMEGF